MAATSFNLSKTVQNASAKVTGTSSQLCTIKTKTAAGATGTTTIYGYPVLDITYDSTGKTYKCVVNFYIWRKDSQAVPYADRVRIKYASSQMTPTGANSWSPFFKLGSSTSSIALSSVPTSSSSAKSIASTSYETKASIPAYQWYVSATKVFTGYIHVVFNVTDDGKKPYFTLTTNPSTDPIHYLANISITAYGGVEYTIKFTDTKRGTSKSVTSSGGYVIVPPSPGNYISSSEVTYYLNYYTTNTNSAYKTDKITLTKRTSYDFNNWGGYTPGTSFKATSNKEIKSNYYSGRALPDSWDPRSYFLIISDPGVSELSFKGWFTSTSGGSQISGSYTPTSTTTNLYARLVATIIFDGNGGSSGGTFTIEYNKQLDSLPTSTRVKHRFDGWFTASTGGSQIYSTTKVYKNARYYAHWTPMYTITYNLNGGSGSYNEQTDVLPITVRSINIVDDNWKTNEENNVIFDFNGGNVFGSIEKNSSVVYHKFKSWKSSANDQEYSGGNKYTYNSDTVMTAQWTLSYSTKALMPYVLKRPGYNFKGWCQNKDGTGTIYNSNTQYTISHSSQKLTLYAIWVPVKNTLKLNFYDKDKVLKTYTKQYTIEDENFTIGIPQTNWNPPYKPLDQEYTFLGWSSGDSINTPTQIAEWQSVYGVYKNVTKAPGYNSDLSKSDLNVLSFTPSRYVNSQYWGEKDTSTPYGTLDSYTGLTSNYYCCWTVSGKYVKVTIDNQNIWKKISVPYVKVGNTWKVIVDTYVKINGEWKKEVGSN